MKAIDSDLLAVNFFARLCEQSMETRLECLATEDPVGAATCYLHAREQLRLAKHNLLLAEETLRGMQNLKPLRACRVARKAK